MASSTVKAGIKDNINTHSLRKTWAYWRFVSGEKTALISKALNHSSERETYCYLGFNQDEMDRVYGGIEL
ncbi:hypothetical protein [Marininema halotolerans]|uniref:hypothetical protein n=1 Tax=Marininema halotolerans TaxID=1155944 RepID=UPI003CCC0EE3